MRHGYGFISGEKAMSKTNPGFLEDITDEVVGYQTGYLFNGSASANKVANGEINVAWFNSLLNRNRAWLA